MAVRHTEIGAQRINSVELHGVIHWAIDSEPRSETSDVKVAISVANAAALVIEVASVIAGALAVVVVLATAAALAIEVE